MTSIRSSAVRRALALMAVPGGRPPAGAVDVFADKARRVRDAAVAPDSGQRRGVVGQHGNALQLEQNGGFSSATRLTAAGDTPHVMTQVMA